MLGWIRCEPLPTGRLGLIEATCCVELLRSSDCQGRWHLQKGPVAPTEGPWHVQKGLYQLHSGQTVQHGVYEAFQMV
jgi:hypothetical protein